MPGSPKSVVNDRSSPNPSSAPTLARHIGLFSLIVYGVGDMVGSGIYGTIGKAAGQMGNAVWLSFIVSMVAAMLTGLSYASIASRYPRAGGAAFVTHHAFGWAFLSYVIGLTVTASGLTSMATSTNVFSTTCAELFAMTDAFGKLRLAIGSVTLVDVPGAVAAIIVLFLLALTFVNFWGIRESLWANLLCTAVEVGGLVFIIIIGARFWGSVNYLETPHATDTTTGLGPVMLLSGAVLTFFAFVGFEDMLNVAEEVKQPERTMPWGIICAVLIATVLYIGIAVTSVSVVHYSELAAAPAPLAAITQRAAAWLPPWVFKGITMFAVANTVLINYIMGSRLLYGMARQGLVPARLGKVHATRRTPHIAILTLLVLVLLLAFSSGVRDLATATGLLLLFCFMVVNASLIVVQFRKGEPRGRFEVPFFIPALGIIVNGALIIARVTEPNAGLRAPTLAGGLMVAIGILYFIVRPRNISEQSLSAIDDV